MSDIEQRLREAMDGVTPGPWFVAGTRARMGRTEYHMICWYDGDKKQDENIAAVWFDPRSGLGFSDARYIATCSPDNIGALLDTIASLRSKLEEAEGARGWQPIETAPKDGQVVWAYLYQSGIRAVRFGTAEEWAELEGGSPDEYEDCWVEADNESETWSPRWWLPYGSLPLSPLASLREG